jgi:DNA-binding LytR/AlgR family response regulator
LALPTFLPGQSLSGHIATTCDKCLVVHDTFKNILEQLPASEFLRIHKSYSIALNKIKYIDGNQVNINNDLIPVGLNFKDDLLKRLGKK